MKVGDKYKIMVELDEIVDIEILAVEGALIGSYPLKKEMLFVNYIQKGRKSRKCFLNHNCLRMGIERYDNYRKSLKRL